MILTSIHVPLEESASHSLSLNKEGVPQVFDGDSDFSSPTSPLAAYLWRPGRHFVQNWSELLRNGDFETYVLDTHDMSRIFQGHAGRSVDVSKCIWHVLEMFHFFSKSWFHVHPIMILMSIHVTPEESASHPVFFTEGVPPFKSKFRS